MIAVAIGFACGIALLLSQAELPDASLAWWALLASPLLFFRHFGFRLLGGAIVAFAWALWIGHQILAVEWPQALEGRDVVASGEIVEMPQLRGDNARFIFSIDQVQTEDGAPTISLPIKARIGWYGRHPAMQAGERWQLVLRLKRPNGYRNPGGFDFEGWLFQQRVRATGYVRDDDRNQRLSESSWAIEGWRQTIRDGVNQALAGYPQVAVLIALAIGDQRGIDEKSWTVFTNTGTNHLVAVSGMHITLIAGLSYFLFRRLWTYSDRLPLYLPAPKAAAVFSLFPAAFYAAMAGFTVPTQRALLMTTVVMLSLVLTRRQRALTVLAVAWVLVLLLDPFALLSAGFWLSFIAVGVIFYAMLSRLSQTGWWWKWGYAQWVVTIGLMPVLIALFGQVPLISPLANLFAIPWVSFVVTPLALVGTILLFIVPFVGKWILVAGAYTMEACWWPLEWLAQWDALLWRQHQPLTWTLPLAAIGTIWLLLPKGWPARWLGGVLCLPMLLVKPEGPGYGDAWVTFLDVGQGLAAVVRTQSQVIVYDTGPRLSDYFDTGEAVVVPFLRSQGISKIDTLIVSHGDLDHRGGVNSILEAMPVDKIMASIEQPLPRAPDAPCIAQPLWAQDGVWMEILHPRAESAGKGNNLACVLRVATNRQSVLLTADIEKQAERQMVEYYGKQLRSDVLLVPHHGSKTSSTEQFLEMVQPTIAVAATGYYNRYRFPKAEVVERYFQHGISFYNTALTGAFTVKLSGHAPLTVEEYAFESRRFWHRHDTFDSGVKD